MLCRYPYMFQGSVPTKCGRCQPCRIQHAQLWTARQVFESLTNQNSTFATLTFAREHHPGSLSKPTLQKFVKRLRKHAPKQKIRYYGCGEYGTKKNRPHYHLSLFGWAHSDREALEKSWRLGTIHLEPFNAATAAYVCGHILKGKTQNGHRDLAGLVPEFNIKSQSLGKDAMKQIAETLKCKHGWDEIQRTGDVPYKVYMGKRALYLGAGLRKVLRTEMGFTDETKTEISAGYLQDAEQEMLDLRQAAALRGPLHSNQGIVSHAFKQNALNMTNRYSIRHGGTL